jgi:subtilisin family serine protease
VRTTRTDFVKRIEKQSALYGAARNLVIGYSTPGGAQKPNPVERDATVAPSATVPPPVPGGDPLSGLLWGNTMIHADPSGSYAVQPGDDRVLVGIIDTGIDGSHPDIAPNFDAALSRNFTTDIPLIDGECADDPDGSCEDPANVDEDGHGTHVAGTVAGALNGLGTSGIAPGVTLVNVRAGQDSGFFFLMPTVDALTYAADIGIDVVNMSFFIDPWLYNCANNPADSRAEQQEQRTIIKATQDALDYAHAHGVTLVAAEGNGHTDLGKPTVDTTSPDFPPGTEKFRNVDNSCLTMPTEGDHVIGVTALGPSQRKAYFSDYGVEQADVSAPGGDRRDFFGTRQYNVPENRILSAYPESVGRAAGTIDENGVPRTTLVLQNCANSVCAYYQYLQGTSMASPHAVGVVALIISEFGVDDPAHPGGLTLDPDIVEDILYSTATDHACPVPRLFDYPDPDLPAEFDARCNGPATDNGFYGNGIVDALAAVS